MAEAGPVEHPAVLVVYEELGMLLLGTPASDLDSGVLRGKRTKVANAGLLYGPLPLLWDHMHV